MYVKKFRGATVSEALAAARRDLGEDALLLGVRRTVSAAGPATEITVALERPAPAGAHAPVISPAARNDRPAVVPPPPSPRPLSPSPALRAIEPEGAAVGAGEHSAPRARAAASALPTRNVSSRAAESEASIAEQRREIAVVDERIRDVEARFDLLSQRIRALARSTGEEAEHGDAADEAVPFVPPTAGEITVRLRRAGLDESLVVHAVRAATAPGPRGVPGGEPELLERLASALAALVPRPRVAPRGMRRLEVLVGPTGTGKTTTAVKEAALARLGQGLRVVLVAADGYRVGAVEELREYALLLDVRHEAAPDAETLAAVLARHADADLVLVDTPGIPPSNSRRMWELSRLLAGAPGAALRLVVSATTRRRDLAAAVARFRALGPVDLVITKLDETEAHAELLAEAISVGCPIAGLGLGQGIPDDFDPNGAERLADLVVRSAWHSAEETR